MFSLFGLDGVTYISVLNIRLRMLLSLSSPRHTTVQCAGNGHWRPPSRSCCEMWISCVLRYSTHQLKTQSTRNACEWVIVLQQLPGDVPS
jgi:hypothetical protein